MDACREFRDATDACTADTARVKAATAELKQKYYSDPQSLILLLHILTSHDNATLQQLAAVEARSLVSKYWNKVPQDQKPTIRNALLQRTLNAPTAFVRHSSARVIAAIARIDLEDGEWADLPGYLVQAAASPTAGHREVGVYILFTLLEVVGDGFEDKLGDLFTLFAKTIRDPESEEVRINTMLALSRLAMLIESDDESQKSNLEAFQQIFPDM